MHFILTESQTPTMASKVLEIWSHPLVFPSHLSPSFLWMVPYPLPLTHILVFLSCYKHPRYILEPGHLFFLLLLGCSVSKKPIACFLVFIGSLPICHVFISLIIWFKIWAFLHTLWFIFFYNTNHSIHIFVFYCLTPHWMQSLCCIPRVWHMKKVNNSCWISCY